MADQVGSGTVHGAVSESAGLEPQMQGLARTETLGASPWKHESFHGRPVSWVAATTIILGFVIGGIGLITGPSWVLFWVGSGVVVAGCILALITGIFNDWY
ncbi:MAG TPA: HGxxPAAW family protein [Streptosporangiaceae bacterium]|nr:HGxxPAAW family protein [Streptosporangiaceae bacterium]